MKKADNFMLALLIPHLHDGIVIKSIMSEAVFLDSNPGSS